jgi:hypothetical protein
MKRKPVLEFVFAAGLLVVSSSLFAHHGTAEYEPKKLITLNATVTRFAWTNPHTQIYFDVTDEQGNVAHWGAEAAPPSILDKSGWSRGTLKPGDKVVISGHPVKSGAPIMILERVVTADGRSLGAHKGQ